MLDTDNTLSLRLTVRDPDTRTRIVDILRGNIEAPSATAGCTDAANHGAEPSALRDLLIELRFVDETRCSETTLAMAPPPTAPPPAPSARKEKIAVTNDLLDRHGVGSGDKTIAIGLAKFWTRELFERYGPPLSPATIRRWREMKRLHGSLYLDEKLDSIEECPGINLPPLVAKVMYQHACRYVTTINTMGGEYQSARAEIDLINRGDHPFHPKPVTPFRMFAFDTFRRACTAVQKTAAEKNG